MFPQFIGYVRPKTKPWGLPKDLCNQTVLRNRLFLVIKQAPKELLRAHEIDYVAQ